ncbi:MAG: acetyl-CoA carboxylase carboxyltransferase subunit beta [Magnetococcales bacterium]|nr:acetyl-CoA carboxylase carboxyltransferase subunit beta [Magnetococcales bacterium]NGZ27329.1 acetyl-CoA carboxylase carboxyltransferase subunit beta [Magnetococcales bacterium]
MNWFSRVLKPKIQATAGRRTPSPEGLWVKCVNCGQALFNQELNRNLDVCPRCQYHFRIPASQRIQIILDEEGREELFASLQPTDPLRFKDLKRYRDRLKESQKETEQNDAVTVYKGTINKVPAVVSAFDFRFMGGSMGSVVGAKIARGALAAVENNCGYVVFATSGGARMQEGIYSLMQMARTSAALTKLEEARLPFISVLTDPTTGGVTASFAMLGDIILAEPNALICFAGPRVIEQTIREKLPEGFQRSEYLLEHGFVDMIVHRSDMKNTISDLLSRLTSWQTAASGAGDMEEQMLQPPQMAFS